MVAHLRMFRAVVDAGCGMPPPRVLCTLWRAACAHAHAFLSALMSCQCARRVDPPLECSVCTPQPPPALPALYSQEWILISTQDHHRSRLFLNKR